MADVSELSDRDLQDQLRAYGVNVGPVVKTTRKLYEKKLSKLIASGGHVEQEPEEYSESEEEEEEEEEEVPVVPISTRQTRGRRLSPVRAPEPTSTYRSPTTTKTDEDTGRYGYSQFSGTGIRRTDFDTGTYGYSESTTTRRTVPDQETSRLRTSTDKYYSEVGASPGPSAASGQTTPPLAQKKGGIPLWIKLLVVIAFGVLVYLVIRNMDPAAQNKVPKSLTDDSPV